MDSDSRKQRGAAKTARIPIKIVPAEKLRKPEWIRIKLGAGAEIERFNEIKDTLREHKLHTVCEEASCPNIHECFGKGTATFMIMGDICTRRCPFCDVGHGRPEPLNANEPADLAKTIAAMRLNYVVITSVDRDDLRDGGAQHFVECIQATRAASPKTTIEVLVPDFRGRMEIALDIFDQAPPDVMNHNLETVPRLYKQARPGSDYAYSLELLKQFKTMGGMMKQMAGMSMVDKMRSMGHEPPQGPVVPTEAAAADSGAPTEASESPPATARFTKLSNSVTGDPPIDNFPPERSFIAAAIGKWNR